MIDTTAIKAADCRTVWAQLGLEEPRGSLAPCPSPDHRDSTPSCQLWPDGWCCHGCGAHGDAIDLVRNVCGLDFKSAVAELARMLSIRVADGAPPPAPRRPSGPRPLPVPSAIRHEAMAEVWRLVGDQPGLHDPACRWLQEQRGIHPRAAWAIGCRSWVEAHDGLLELWRRLTPEQRVEVGLATERGRPWWPLRQPLRFLAIPCWRPGEAYPIAWRGRALDPGSGPKELAQPGRSLWPAVGFEVHRDGQPAPRPGIAPTLIVCEGAMDLLAVVDVLEELGRQDVAAVGLTAPSGGWRTEWTAAVRGCQRVLVVAHDRHGPRVAQQIAAAFPAGHVAAATPPESNDLNDLHRAGRLAALIGGWL